MHTTLRLPVVRCLVTALLLISLLRLLNQPVRPVHAASLAPAATIVVTNCSDGVSPGPPGSLRNAISTASAGDTITFSLSCTGSNAIKLMSTLIITTDHLTVDGSGHQVTLDGQHLVQVLQVSDVTFTFTLNALTIANGSGGDGGGLNNNGTVNISNSTFANNAATTDGGGIYNNNGTVNISNSTFATNSADDDGGGILNALGTVNISNSTFATNSATSEGGGIDNERGTVNISNSTFATNSASGGFGGGIDNEGGTVSIGQSIVANNGSSNCSGNSTTDQGYNLESGTDCGFTQSTDQQKTNPLLDPLGLNNNGGPTQTIALQSGSPAIDKIPAALCPKTDQRGFTRPDDRESVCDIGAFEFEAVAPVPPPPPPVQQLPPPNEPYEPYSPYGPHEPGHRPYGPGYGPERPYRPYGPGHRPQRPDQHPDGLYGPDHRPYGPGYGPERPYRPDGPGHHPDGPWW